MISNIEQPIRDELLSGVQAYGYIESKNGDPLTCEDAMLFDDDIHLYGVFDGAGGVRGGRKAALLSVEQFQQEGPTAKSAYDLAHIAKSASDVISEDPEAGITTCSVVKVVDYLPDRKGYKVSITNSGDSRIYRYNPRNNELRLLTIDDGELADKYEGDELMIMNRTRRMSEIFDERDIEDASGNTVQEFGKRNKIFNGLGIDGPMEFTPGNVRDLYIPEGDVLIITCDGITDNLGEGDETPSEYRIENLIGDAYRKDQLDRLPKILVDRARQVSEGGRNLLERGIRSIRGREIVRSKSDDRTAIVINLGVYKNIPRPISSIDPKSAADSVPFRGRQRGIRPVQETASAQKLDQVISAEGVPYPISNVRKKLVDANGDPSLLALFDSQFPGFREPSGIIAPKPNLHADTVVEASSGRAYPWKNVARLFEMAEASGDQRSLDALVNRFPTYKNY